MSCSRTSQLAATGAAVTPTRLSAQALLRSWLRLLRHRVHHMQECARQRRALRNLDDRLLADIGISRAQAACEANKRLWPLLVTGRC